MGDRQGRQSAQEGWEAGGAWTRGNGMGLAGGTKRGVVANWMRCFGVALAECVCAAWNHSPPQWHHLKQTTNTCTDSEEVRVLTVQQRHWERSGWTSKRNGGRKWRGCTGHKTNGDGDTNAQQQQMCAAMRAGVGWNEYGQKKRGCVHGVSTQPGWPGRFAGAHGASAGKVVLCAGRSGRPLVKSNRGVTG